MRRFLVGVALLMAILGASYLGLFCTTTGSSWVLKWLSQTAPIKFEYSALQGNLHQGLQLHQVKLPLLNQMVILRRVNARVRLSPTYNPLHWEIDIDTGHQDLARLIPQVEGSVVAHIKSRGKMSLALNYAATLTITKLTGNIYQQALVGYGTLQLSQDKTVTIKHLHLQTAKNYVDLNGTLTDQWQVQWDVHLPNLGQISHQLHGKIIGNGTIEGPKLGPHILGYLQCSDFSYGHITVQRLELQSQLSEHQMALRLSARHIRYQKLEFATITASGQLTPQQQTLNLVWQSGGNIFTLNMQGALQAKTTWQGVIDLSNLQPFNAASRLKILAKLSPQHRFKEWHDYPLDIHVTGKLNSLSFLKSFLTEVNQLEGYLEGDWQISGTLRQPKLHGKATIQQGQLSILKWGTELTQIHLIVTSLDPYHIQFEGQGNVAEGQLNIVGRTHFLPNEILTELDLTGKNALLIKTPSAKVTMNPKVKIIIHDRTLDITGSIGIPSALITPEDYSSTIRLSDDVIFTSDLEKNRRPWHIITRINVNLGSHVLLSFMGLKAVLGGEIILRDSPVSATTASGQLYVKHGHFDAYNQRLQIQQGQLLFTGGLITNPGLNIRAIKKIGAVAPMTKLPTHENNYISGDALVGVKVTGTLYKPQMSLFSQPSGLSQAQILSYLMLGSPATDSDKNREKLLDDLKTTSSHRHKMLNEHLQRALKLDELSLKANPTTNSEHHSDIKNTSLTVGKLLSPQLLVSYSVGLLEPVNILNFTYQINKNWLLRSQTDLDVSSIDLLYSVETN